MSENRRFLRFYAVGGLCVLVGACGPPGNPFPPPPTYLQTVDGPMIGVEQRSITEQMNYGLRVRIQPAGSPIVLVDLAPGWYLDQQGLHLSQHDRLKVEGTIPASDGVLRAQRLTKGMRSVRLRDEQGRPYWDPTFVPTRE